MSHYKQQFEHPIKFYVMSIIKELCDKDKTLKFKISDLTSLVQEKQPGITQKQIRQVVSTIIVPGGFIKNVGRSVTGYGSGSGGKEAYFAITQKGIECDPMQLPSSKEITKARKSIKAKKPSKIKESSKLAQENEGDDGKLGTVEAIDVSDIDALIESVDLSVYKKDQIQKSNIFVQQFLIYLKQRRDEIVRYQIKLEDAQRKYNKLSSELRSIIKDKERDIEKLNETVIKLREAVQRYSGNKSINGFKGTWPPRHR